MRYLALKFAALWLVFTSGAVSHSWAAEKLVALYSSHAVPYSMPWIAEELGLFRKYDLDFGFVYIPSSSTATAAILGNNVEVGLVGGIGIVNAYAGGATDLCFIAASKTL